MVIKLPSIRPKPSGQDVPSLLRPAVGDEAAGYGVKGKIDAVPDLQPLGHDGIWRVTVCGETLIRVVRQSIPQGDALSWKLLQMDDMSDEQLDLYEVALSNIYEADYACEQIGKTRVKKS